MDSVVLRLGQGTAMRPLPRPRPRAGRLAAPASSVARDLVPSSPHMTARSRFADPMLRTSNALLLNTAFTGGLGLLYWFIAAHTFPASAVGRGGALVAATALVSGFGMLNLSGALMRFLPHAGPRSRQLLLRVYGVSALVSLAFAVMFVALYRLFASPNSDLRLPTLVAVLFVMGVVATTIFTLEDNALTGLRAAAPWVPLENSTFGVAKIALLLAMAPLATYSAIYASWVLPMFVIVPLVNLLLFKRLLPVSGPYSRRTPVSAEARRRVFRFVRGDTSGGIFQLASTYGLPLIVITALGSLANSRFYVAALFSSSVDLVATNLSTALTVEGSHAEDNLSNLARATLRRIALVVLPLVAVLVLAAPVILGLYGTNYVQATGVFRLLLLASIPRALVVVYYGICRVTHQTHVSAVLKGISSALTLGGAATAAAGNAGLRGVGWIVFGVQLGLAAILLPSLARTVRSH